LLTNDVALSQIARLQQVAALNVSDLARALRPMVVAGDKLELSLVKGGRDPHQAVGYLPDATIIVVNHRRLYVGTFKRSRLDHAADRGWPAPFSPS
jgi:uncharacterized protein YacL